MFADAEVFRIRLEKIEIALEYLKPQVNEQTKDVDELLEIYENGVRIFHAISRQHNLSFSWLDCFSFESLQKLGIPTGRKIAAPTTTVHKS